MEPEYQMGRLMARALLRFLYMSLRTFVTVVTLSALVHASEMPLTVGDVVTGASSHVRVTNTARQHVTAWSLAAISRTSTGTHREVYTADGYLSEATHGLPGSNPRLERLAPGESRELPLDPLPSGSTVEVIAAVLEDGTAIGDEEALASIFAKRAKERDALKAVADAFRDVLPATHGAEALASLRDRFAALVQRDDAVPCRAALAAVQAYQQKTNADEIDRALQQYASFVGREYDLAARHAKRRGIKN
jgi:hypothetical protein